MIGNKYILQEGTVSIESGEEENEQEYKIYLQPENCMIVTIQERPIYNIEKTYNLYLRSDAEQETKREKVEELKKGKIDTSQFVVRRENNTQTKILEDAGFIVASPESSSISVR